MPNSPTDNIIIARLTGTAKRHTRRPLSADQHDAAVTELADIAAGRADLLAQAAGLTAGFYGGHPDEDRHLRAAQLCIEAGADVSQVTRWTEEGHRRAAHARATRQHR